MMNSAQSSFSCMNALLTRQVSTGSLGSRKDDRMDQKNTLAQVRRIEKRMRQESAEGQPSHELAQTVGLARTDHAVRENMHKAAYRQFLPGLPYRTGAPSIHNDPHRDLVKKAHSIRNRFVEKVDRVIDTTDGNNLTCTRRLVISLAPLGPSLQKWKEEVGRAFSDDIKKLVAAYCRSYLGVDPADIEQKAWAYIYKNIIPNYDPNQSTDSTLLKYTLNRLRNKLKELVYEDQKVIYMPVRLQSELRRALDHAERDLMKQGTDPTLEQLAETTGIPLHHVIQIRVPLESGEQKTTEGPISPFDRKAFLYHQVEDRFSQTRLQIVFMLAITRPIVCHHLMLKQDYGITPERKIGNRITEFKRFCRGMEQIFDIFNEENDSQLIERIVEQESKLQRPTVEWVLQRQVSIYDLCFLRNIAFVANWSNLEEKIVSIKLQKGMADKICWPTEDQYIAWTIKEEADCVVKVLNVDSESAEQALTRLYSHR